VAWPITSTIVCGSRPAFAPRTSRRRSARERRCRQGRTRSVHRARRCARSLAIDVIGHEWVSDLQNVRGDRAVYYSEGVAAQHTLAPWGVVWSLIAVERYRRRGLRCRSPRL
jgi:hypothetical protein